MSRCCTVLAATTLLTVFALLFMIESTLAQSPANTEHAAAAHHGDIVIGSGHGEDPLPDSVRPDESYLRAGQEASGSAWVYDGPHLDGSGLAGIWVLPFFCMLLSIAVMPLTVPRFWHHHFGKVSAFWGLAFLGPFAVKFGSELALFELLHTVLLEYIPFIILLLALFTVAGGVRLTGSLAGTPVVNLLLLAMGTALASWMGTTGAAMLLIRPLLRANAHRKHRVHTVVFFIFLVANIGGSLTPLGDPPLFLGFLKGVSFFWTARAMFKPMMLVAGILLIVFLIIDIALYSAEGRPAPPISGSGGKLRLEGKVNLLLLAGIVSTVLMSGMWNPGISFCIYHVPVELQDLVRDVLLLCICGLSLKHTDPDSRRKNDFNWFPIVEIAKLFAGIFISMIPVIAILRAGMNGALKNVVSLVTAPDGTPVNYWYFWLSGGLSSFLDNAPTYLVFFHTAGGDAQKLMDPQQMYTTLVAISAGCVFMGANTYIGNAPNFMIRSIAYDFGVRMPSFFGYMAWSLSILTPCFLLVMWIFFI